MKELQLISYLRKNLKFGCIFKSSYDLECSDSGVSRLSLMLYPHSKFYQNDISFIRNSVLESDTICKMPYVKLKNLCLDEDSLLAVYIIG